MITLTTATVDDVLLFLAWRDNRLIFGLPGEEAVAERLAGLGIAEPKLFIAAAQQHGMVDISEVGDPLNGTEVQSTLPDAKAGHASIPEEP